MNILGINPFHNGSVCVLSDGKILEYIEEERLTRKKYDELPFKSILYMLKKYEIDYVVIAGLNHRRATSTYFIEEVTESFIKKFNFNPKNIFRFDDYHHLAHISSAFYNSGFTEAVGIVVDAGGSALLSNPYNTEKDTLYHCSYPNNFEVLYQNLTPYNQPLHVQPVGIGKAFEHLCQHLGFDGLDGGKVMGLSSYGNPDNNLPNLFNGNNTDVSIVNRETTFTCFFPKNYTTEWHHDESKITNLEKDLSWKIQKESQDIVLNYISTAIEQTKLNKVVMAGGYGLNCVANYYFKKHLPQVDFYFEPIAHDGGTAIGAAKWIYYEKTKNTKSYPQTTLYYGPKYSKETLLEGIKKYT